MPPYFYPLTKREDENPTIGILLCPKKNHTVVELTIPDESTIIASEYQLYLPEKKELENRVDKWITEFEEVQDSSAENVYPLEKVR